MKDGICRVAKVPPPVQSTEAKTFSTKMNDAESLSACIYYKHGLHSLMQKGSLKVTFKTANMHGHVVYARIKL